MEYCRYVLRRVSGVPTADLLLVGGLVLAGQVELWVPTLLDGQLAEVRPVVAPFAVLVPGSLVLRRRSPLATVATATAAVVCQAFAAAPAIMLVQIVAVLAAVYSVAAHASLGRSLVGFLIACAGPATMAALSSGAWTETASIAVFAGAPWVAGRVVRRVRQYATLLEEMTAALERERARSAELAVAQTRSQIARELHDVLAHGVGVMTLQAGGARRMVERDPARVRSALATIERTGREALGELRRLLNGLDPHDPAAAPTDPRPSIVDACARLRRTVGDLQPLDLRVDGRPRPLPAGLELAASRIVQEAVVNATRHARGSPVTVRVAYRPDELTLTVENGPPAAETPPGDPGSGRGIIGMRERVSLYGGTFAAGPTRDGGFLVEAQLPAPGEQR